MAAANPKNYTLEPEALAFSEATLNPPFLYQLDPAEGRKVVDGVQDSEIFKPEVDEKWIKVPGGPTGPVPTRIVKPKGATGTLPVVIYTHGAGWVFGDAHTHDRLVRDLAIGTGAAVVFPEYDRSPDVKYPVANEQSYAVAKWVAQNGAEEGLDGTNVAIAGDSVGGNMAIALTLLAKERGDVTFKAQVLFYPVTDASFDNGSYTEFAEGYWLTRTAMQWFWDQYTSTPQEREEITVSPLRATAEDVKGLPQALVINAECDVLRDEGEAYASKLRAAGVEVTGVRYEGIIHDFVMLNALHDTPQSKAAIAQAAAFLKDALSA
ncbi:alpha/beta hydrolase [Nocardioides sp. CER19]|uniref:alpha/beta hydrolase n=1 Tax=Nocardioides sp. CER19 TaxID=3038538 RepID=UPI00244CF776|nr:alpha/beta hydrolase [Nocardioides sp. CER19]MDH2413865.1 alpha/beta hydrolase [Nocardioides sp. CER19]